MSHELEPIIRRIDARSQAKPGRVVVAIDRKSGKVVPEAGFFGIAVNFLRDVILYEVTVDEMHWIGDARASVQVFPTNERSDLAFRMRVKVPRANASAAVEALYNYERSPAQVLFDVVRTHVSASLEESAKQGPESVLERIAANRVTWQAELTRVIDTRLHLTAEIVFELQRPIIDTDVIIRVQGIPVSPKDAPHDHFPVTVSLVLARTPARVTDPLPRSDEERQRLISDVVTKAFRDRIALYSYWFQPEVLNRDLARALDELLPRYAYSLKSLAIDPIEPPVTAEEQIVDDVSWTGRLARPIPFHIESKVRMAPAGAGVYHARKSPSRKDWIKKEVQAALKSAMHGRDFIDLTAEAEREVHNTVHRLLNESARTIGHEVDTFVASAAIPEKIWLDPVTVVIARREYKTKNDLVPAEFEIRLVVQMTTLARLEDLIQAHRLTRPNDATDGANGAIRAAIVESATRAAESIMSQVEPRDYFSQYEQWEVFLDDEETTGPQNYVRNRLVRAVQDELKADFHIVRCDVNPRRVDSRVAKVLTLIHKMGDIEVTVEIEPQRSEGPHQAAKIYLVYYIGGVAPDQWANVIQRGSDPLPHNRLTTDLKNWSREALTDRSLDDLYGLMSRRTNNVDVRREVETIVAGRVVIHYGVVIGIKSINWEYNRADQLEREIASLSTLQDRVRLEKYKRQLGELQRETDDQAKRDYLRQRRDALQRLIVGNKRQTTEELERVQQHETELAEVERQLAGARNTLVPEGFQRLAAPSETNRPSGPEMPPDDAADDEPRDTRL